MTSQKSFSITKRIKSVGRLAHITNVFAKHGFWTLFESSGIENFLNREQVKEAQAISKTEFAKKDKEPSTLPKRVRQAMEELGPAFVKLGQVLATREDIIPSPFIKEFRKLHQNVAPIPFEVVKGVLEEELGEEGLSKIEFIDEKPIAAGSIGQVHVAVLKTGERVVIKIQRPNIHEQFRIDLDLMEVLAQLLEKYIAEMEEIKPSNIIEEFGRSTVKELDYIREAANTSKVGVNFKDIAHINIPDVFWELTTSKVITLTYIDGYPIRDKEALQKAGLDPHVLMERGLAAVMHMVFVDGFYHGDLHSGNLVAMPNNEVGFIDFGLSMRLGKATRENLAGLLVALVNEDYEALVAHFTELTNPGPNFNVMLFEEEVANTISPFLGLRLSEIPSGQLLWDLLKVAAQHGAPLPRPLVIFFKTLVSLEDVGSHLEPDFDLMKTCEQFAQKLVKRMYSPRSFRRQSIAVARDVANLARTAPRQLREFLKLALDGNLTFRVENKYIVEATDTISKTLYKLTLGLIVAALIIGSSILVTSHVGQQYRGYSILGLVGFALSVVLSLMIIIPSVKLRKK